MKPAPPRKPKRIRVVLVYTTEEYRGLKGEEAFLAEFLHEKDLSVKSIRAELAEWGSGKGSFTPDKLINNRGNNSDIVFSTKNQYSKYGRHIDLAAMKAKKPRN